MLTDAQLGVEEKKEKRKYCIERLYSRQPPPKTQPAKAQ
jgi:hypothetical protein